MGKLYFICGEMGSGKTARLIADAARAKAEATNSVEITIMKPGLDTKNGSKLLSRNGSECKVDHLISEDEDLFSLVSKEFQHTRKLFVDEAQFLSAKQVDQMLKLAALQNVDVSAYGLRLNFNLGDEDFEGATRLLQVAHNIIVLNSKCDICGKKQAIFSCLFKGGKVLRNAPTILISDGKNEVNAKAVCADCYYHSL